MKAVFLIILILVILFVIFRILVDLQNDPTMTISEIIELNLNRFKNLFKLKK